MFNTFSEEKRKKEWKKLVYGPNFIDRRIKKTLWGKKCFFREFCSGPMWAFQECYYGRLNVIHQKGISAFVLVLFTYSFRKRKPKIKEGMPEECVYHVIVTVKSHHRRKLLFYLILWQYYSNKGNGIFVEMFIFRKMKYTWKYFPTLTVKIYLGLLF